MQGSSTVRWPTVDRAQNKKVLDIHYSIVHWDCHSKQCRCDKFARQILNTRGRATRAKMTKICTSAVGQTAARYILLFFWSGRPQ
jgi:hypothetical protein